MSAMDNWLEHSEQTKADAAARLRRSLELRRRGFRGDIVETWLNRETELGRQVCFHVAVGVPEFMTSGLCSTCWKPPLLKKCQDEACPNTLLDSDPRPAARITAPDGERDQVCSRECE